MESYCSLCTFKVPQGANNLTTLYFRYYTQIFFVTRLIINKINKVHWVDFKLENVLVSLHSVKTMGLGESYLNILLYLWTYNIYINIQGKLTMEDPRKYLSNRTISIYGYPQLFCYSL